MDKIFLLSSKAYNVRMEEDPLGRSLAVTDSEQSGRTMDHTMGKNIIGTFYNYTMKIYPKVDDLASCDTPYNIISDPNYASHKMIFPYGQETLAFQTYIGQGKGKLRVRNGENIWDIGGLSLSFTVMGPQGRR